MQKMKLTIINPELLPSNQLEINYNTCPTPTNLMGKPREEVEKWRRMMAPICGKKRKFDDDEFIERSKKNKY